VAVVTLEFFEERSPPRRIALRHRESPAFGMMWIARLPFRSCRRMFGSERWTGSQEPDCPGAEESKNDLELHAANLALIARLSG
jgi:hypothetical protein